MGADIYDWERVHGPGSWPLAPAERTAVDTRTIRHACAELDRLTALHGPRAAAVMLATGLSAGRLAELGGAGD